MRCLDPPSDDAAGTYRRCAGAVRNVEKRTRMLSAEGEIVAAAVAYMNAAINAVLHEIPQTEGVDGSVSKQEMMDLYKSHMSRKDAVAREVYERLMSAPRHGKCPLCGQRTVSTLDHHLPESIYPLFAVFPHNLVPVCKDCNHQKLTATPSDADHQTIHPYFDDYN